MQGNQDLSSFRFHITETVFISKDQPAVEQIEEIELVPEIEVFIKEDEIKIAGNLALYGEYRGKRRPSMTENERYLQESDPAAHYPPFEAEDSVFSPWRKSGEIYHRIPVSISLPKEKIPDTGEIFAIVDAFDYDIKSPHQLLITAELVLTGIRDKMEIPAGSAKVKEAPQFVTVAGKGEDLTDDEDEVDSWDYFLEHEKQRQHSLREEQSDKVVPLDSKQNDTEQVDKHADHSDQVDKNLIDDAEKDSSHSTEFAFESVRDPGEKENEQLVRDEGEQRTAEVKIGFKSKASRPEEKPIDLKSVFNPSAVEANVTGSDFGWEKKIEQSAVKWAKEEEYAWDEAKADGADRSESPEEEQAVESGEKEDARYLTNFMRNREELFTRLTMCIVQKEEELPAIAKRYEVPIDVLMRFNRLESDRVEEGQLLYIPKSMREKEE